MQIMVSIRQAFSRDRLGEVIVALVLVCASLMLWRISATRDQVNLQSQAASRARSYASEAGGRYRRIGDALGRLSIRGLPEGGSAEDIAEWSEESAFYRRTFAGLTHVVWVDASLKIGAIDPHQDAVHGQRVSDAFGANEDVKLWVPVYRGSVLQGFVVGVVDAEAFLLPEVQDAGEAFAFEIRDQGDLVLSSGDWEASDKGFLATSTATLPNAAVWSISVAPTRQMVRSVVGRSRTTLAFSLFLSMMATVALHYAQSHRKLSQLNEMRFSQMLESMMEGCQIIGSDWRFRFVNDAAAALYGTLRDSLIGQTMQQVVPDLEKTALYPLLQRSMEARTRERLLDEITLPDGSGTWHEFSIQPAPDGVLILSSDVTERERQAEALRQSEARFRAITTSSPDAVFIVDRDGGFAYVNPAACRMLGYTAGELEPLGLGDVGLSGTRPSEYLKRLLEQDILSVELELRHRDGTMIPVDVCAVVLPNGMVYASCRDISERREAAKAQESLELQLRQAQKMEAVGRLAGGVAHDFNNMLGVIIGYTEMMMTDVGADQPLYEGLQEVMTAARRSADLTSQLLAFARRQPIAPKRLNLNEAVEDTLSMLRRLIGEEIELSWLPKARLWPIKMDPSQVSQILTNLCANARDAIDGVGKVVIETGHIVVDEAYCDANVGSVPGEYVLLSVSDNGCGMDQATMAHVFEPFFTTKGVGQGTGLGLATVYGIVRQNKGFINIYSEPGLGSSIRLYLPRQSEEVSRQREPEAPLVRGSGETILLVEDEPSILAMGRTMLAQLGYRVLAAATPDEALAIVSETSEEIRLLLTDVVMPSMSGKELVERLRIDRPTLRHLYMSGYTADIISERGVLANGDELIQKPFSMQRLADKVHKALQRADD